MPLHGGLLLFVCLCFNLNLRIFAEISKMSEHRRLRKDTINFLEVKEELTLPVRVLPQGIDVLKVMIGRRNKEKELNINLPVMCDLIPGSFEPKCFTKDGCRVKSDHTKWCVVSQILERYEQAAIPFRKPDKIEKKCQELFHKYWDNIRKQKEYTGASIVQKRENFIKEHLQALFPAFHAQVEAEINKDKKRTQEKKDEDIAFFKDQMSVRNMALDTRDVKYDKEVRLEAEREERKKQREETMNKRVEKHEDYIPPTNGKEEAAGRRDKQSSFLQTSCHSLFLRPRAWVSQMVSWWGQWQCS